MKPEDLARVFDQKRLRRRPFFFINDQLHKRLYVHRGRDLVIAWNFATHQEVKYLYTDWKRNSERAYTLPEIALLIGRHRDRLNTYVAEGQISRPYQSYTLDGERRPGKYYFREKDVLEIHEFFCGLNRRGRAAKSGVSQEETLTPRSEVQRILAGGKVLYRMDEKGKMIPVWKA